MWQPTLDEVQRLYEQHAKHLEASHWGQYLALAPDGRFVVGRDDVAVFCEAVQQLGEGNFVLLRIGEMDVDILRRIIASVTSSRYPFWEVVWQVRQHRQHDHAYADTGFKGFLNIPSRYITLLGRSQGVVRARGADGSVLFAETYIGTVEIVGLNDSVTARILALSDEFLLGRRVLDRYRVTFDRGQQLVVERL